MSAQIKEKQQPGCCSQGSAKAAVTPERRRRRRRRGQRCPLGNLPANLQEWGGQDCKKKKCGQTLPEEKLAGFLQSTNRLSLAVFIFLFPRLQPNPLFSALSCFRLPTTESSSLRHKQTREQIVTDFDNLVTLRSPSLSSPTLSQHCCCAARIVSPTPQRHCFHPLSVIHATRLRLRRSSVIPAPCPLAQGITHSH